MRYLKDFFYDLWWMWILALCLFAVYWAFSLPIKHEIAEMTIQKKELIKEIDLLNHQVQSRRLRIKRNDDPRWQELLIMNRLNLAPRAYRKWIIPKTSSKNLGDEQIDID